MAEQKDNAPQAKAKVYRIKNGALEIKHPSMGITITKDHLSGPNAETFIKAIQKEEKKGKTKGWIDSNLELA